jgi:inhibitor of cysteine peptidase
MNVRGPLLLLLAAAGLVINAGSASSVTVGRDACGQPVAMEVDERLEVTLDGNPTTGFLWLATEPLPSGLRQEEERMYRRDSTLVGGGGFFTLRFVALGEGEGELKLVYRRPWEDGVPPAATCTFRVAVRKKAGLVLAVYVSSRDEQMEARFDLSAETVTVTLPDGRCVTLPAATSASGARYSNGRETFWEHQGAGRFFVGDTLLFEGSKRASGFPASGAGAPERTGEP